MYIYDLWPWITLKGQTKVIDDYVGCIVWASFVWNTESHTHPLCLPLYNDWHWVTGKNKGKIKMYNNVVSNKWWIWSKWNTCVHVMSHITLVHDIWNCLKLNWNEEVKSSILSFQACCGQNWSETQTWLHTHNLCKSATGWADVEVQR